jgi:signal transduction histidine kinase
MTLEDPLRPKERLTPREHQERAAVDQVFDLKMVRILMLEDSQIDAELIRERILRTVEAAEISQVVLREEFEAALEKTGFDLILADYSLPGFDGMAALDIARQVVPETPFIVVSGVLGEEFAIEALKRGATDYVLKQRLSRLPAAMRRALSEAYERRERRLAEERLHETLRALRENEEHISRLNETLERRVEERTRELEAQIEERERVEATLRQMQRLEAVGQLTSGVAHDFNNLLTVILGNVGFLSAGVEDSKLRRRLQHIHDAAERGSKLTAQLLAFSRRQRLEPKPLDLNQTVHGMTDLLKSTMGGSVRVETISKPDLWPALVDPTQIELVILNLAINARDAMQVGGSLTVETGNVTLTQPPQRPEEPEPGDYVMVSVTDTGSGIPPEVLAKVFEPFFTTKEIGKGSGLGLSQVLGFAQQSGGGVCIESRDGEGTSVKVYLPRSKAAPQRERTEPGPLDHRPMATPVDGRMPQLLVVDDDSAVREITCALLRELGYGVTEAGSGRQALDLLASGSAFDLLLIDYAMPGMNGGELAGVERDTDPGQKIVFITGYADFAALAALGEDRVVQKPFRDGELAQQVAIELGQAPMGNVTPLRKR